MNAQAFYARLNALSISADLDACEKLAQYHLMLKDYNTRMDLTAVTDDEEMLDKHYADSLVPLRFDGFFPVGTKMIDVGTGAGFPGLPIAIMRPDMFVTLLDAQNKRVGFLNDVIKALNLKNVQAIHMRAEDAARDIKHREMYDIAAARALAALPTLLEYVLPFVKIGGKALLWKGPAVLEEINACRPVARLLGGSLNDPMPVPIAGRDYQHVIVSVDKSSATIRQYPRRSGIPQKTPLQVDLK